MANTVELYANNASSTLAGAISNVAVALNLASGTGSLFPSPNNVNGEFFRLSLTDLSTGLLHEIVYVTSRTGDTCTILRAQEGTVAQAWQAGDLAANQNTAGAMRNVVQVVQAQTSAFSYDATDTGTANNYAIQLTPAMPTGVDGTPLRFKAANANTGASTLTVDGGTSYPLTGVDGAALQGGEITANSICFVAFNSSGTPGYTLLTSTNGNSRAKASTKSGQAVNQSQVIGVADSLQNVTASRALGTVYTNSTGKPIFIYVQTTVGSGQAAALYMNSGQIGNYSNTTGSGQAFMTTALIPAGYTYEVRNLNTVTLTSWFEIRT